MSQFSYFPTGKTWLQPPPTPSSNIELMFSNVPLKHFAQSMEFGTCFFLLMFRKVCKKKIIACSTSQTTKNKSPAILLIHSNAWGHELKGIEKTCPRN